MDEHFKLRTAGFVVLFLILVSISLSTALDRDDGFLKSVRNSGRYNYGEGYGKTEEDARRQARVRLLESIVVSITSITTDQKREANFEIEEEYESILTSYSSLSLQNLQTDTFEDRDGWYAVSYISKTDLEASFRQEKQKVQDMVKLARQAESEARIGDALKMLYWAYLRTHTYVGQLDLGLEGIDVSDARIAIEMKMKKIVSNLAVNAAPCVRSAGSTQTTLAFFYSGFSVKNLDFTYYCGEGDDPICISDGEKAYITIYKELTQHRVPLPLRIDYVYFSEMRSQPEILNLYGIFKDKCIDLFVEVDLIAPWIPEDRVEQPRPKRSVPVVKSLPKPALRDWSFSILVLADIKDKREFQEELTKLKDTKILYTADNLYQLSKSDRHYLALYCDQSVTALLYYDGVKYKNVRTGREYADYKSLLPAEGEISGTWIGEANK